MSIRVIQNFYAQQTFLTTINMYDGQSVNMAFRLFSADSMVFLWPFWAIAISGSKINSISGPMGWMYGIFTDLYMYVVDFVS